MLLFWLRIVFEKCLLYRCFCFFFSCWFLHLFGLVMMPANNMTWLVLSRMMKTNGWLATKGCAGRLRFFAMERLVTAAASVPFSFTWMNVLCLMLLTCRSFFLETPDRSAACWSNKSVTPILVSVSFRSSWASIVNLGMVNLSFDGGSLANLAHNLASSSWLLFSIFRPSSCKPSTSFGRIMNMLKSPSCGQTQNM